MSKIKNFFLKIKNAIGSFFKMISNAISKFFSMIAETKVMRKISYWLGWLPNKIGNKLSFNTKKAVWGVIFIIPLMIGFIYFFLLPFISTVIYSFSNVKRITELDVTGTAVGTVTEWVGFDNYKYVWNVHSTFKETLISAFTDTLLDVLLILIFSLIIAVVLNSKFRGRAFVRAVFFMPVIFNSQAIDAAMAAGSALTDAMEGANNDVLTSVFNFSDFLTNANLPVTAVTFLTDASNSIFDVISCSGVQILIFLSGIQSVPKHLYEAAKMEGATQYEIFWKITFPMVSPLMLTAGVYTVVDSFLRSDLLSLMASYQSPGNRDFTQGLGALTNDGIYAAMSMLFVLLSVFSLVIVFVVISRMVFYYDE
ncbi:MAG: sugar ABC transporter permease [Bacilli bacterium]|nr:sugar ABC transporter permease [Bacilli bacterium]